MKTGMSEVKSQFRHQTSYVFPQSPKKKMGRGKESKDKADSKSLYGAGVFCEDHDDEEWVRSQNCLKWEHTVCANYSQSRLRRPLLRQFPAQAVRIKKHQNYPS
jgi:hypothetical protein